MATVACILEHYELLAELERHCAADRKNAQYRKDRARVYKIRLIREWRAKHGSAK